MSVDSIPFFISVANGEILNKFYILPKNSIEMESEGFGVWKKYWPMNSLKIFYTNIYCESYKGLLKKSSLYLKANNQVLSDLCFVWDFWDKEESSRVRRYLWALFAAT